MNTSDKYIAMNRIREAADQLSIMSDDLDRVGMSVLSEKLYLLSRSIQTSVSDLHTIDGEEVAAYVNQSQQASVNMLNACLAGAELQRRLQ